MLGQNALVYGATGGIGSAICWELSSQGFNCCIIGRSREKLNQIQKELEIPKDNLLCVPSITTEADFEAVNNWINKLEQQFSVAIHCAGFGLFKRASALTLKEWRSLMDANLNSAFSFYKLVWEFRTTDQFELVYFGSASTDNPWPKNSLYGASKAGLEMFARSLQTEIHPKGGRVWLYKPGSVNTGFFNSLPNHLPKEKMIDPKVLAKVVVENLQTDPSIYFPVTGIYSE